VSVRSSHGDGRRMSMAEAVERRARMIRFHGSLEAAHRHGHGFATDPEPRETRVECTGYALDADDVKFPDLWVWIRAWIGWDCVLCNDGVATEAEDIAFDVSDGCIVPACPACRGVA
jgi:hypothetical protein